MNHIFSSYRAIIVIVNGLNRQVCIKKRHRNARREITVRLIRASLRMRLGHFLERIYWAPLILLNLPSVNNGQYDVGREEDFWYSSKRLGWIHSLGRICSSANKIVRICLAGVISIALNVTSRRYSRAGSSILCFSCEHSLIKTNKLRQMDANDWEAASWFFNNLGNNRSNWHNGIVCGSDR